jgi:hypothetical protein
MIQIDFFGCRKEQIVTCTWDDAFERYPSTGITLPDASALISLSEALGGPAFSAERVPLAAEPFHELCKGLTDVIRNADAEELRDAGARWAHMPPWRSLETNPMDLAGFLLHLQSLVVGPGNADNAIFLWVESGDLPDAR